MHSLTYTQKSCRHSAGSRDAYVYIRTFFATRKLQRAGQRAESKKKCIHYIYTKCPFFIFKKCIHYIYTRNHISSRQLYFQRPSHYSPTPQICRQQAEIGQITTNHYCSSTPHAYPHFAGSRIKYTTQQSQATSATTTTRQKDTHLPRRRHIHIFSPIFPASFKMADREHTSDRRRKKRKRGMKRC